MSLQGELDDLDQAYAELSAIAAQLCLGAMDAAPAARRDGDDTQHPPSRPARRQHASAARTAEGLADPSRRAVPPTRPPRALPRAVARAVAVRHVSATVESALAIARRIVGANAQQSSDVELPLPSSFDRLMRAFVALNAGLALRQAGGEMFVRLARPCTDANAQSPCGVGGVCFADVAQMLSVWPGCFVAQRDAEDGHVRLGLPTGALCEQRSKAFRAALQARVCEAHGAFMAARGLGCIGAAELGFWHPSFALQDVALPAPADLNAVDWFSVSSEIRCEDAPAKVLR